MIYTNLTFNYVKCLSSQIFSRWGSSIWRPSRRNNLVFFNTGEPENETNFDCEIVLLIFLYDRLKLGHSDIEKIFQRVHKLGKRRQGQLPNGDDPKPRPIIAGFRDYKWREEVLSRAKNLKGTSFSIQQDFPADIRTARGKLWQQFTQARSEGLRATIAYPAKLIVEGEMVKDMFPGWGKWAFSDIGGISERSHQDSDTRGSPRTVTLADYINAAEFVPRRSATVGRKSQNNTTSDAEMDCSGSADANGLSSSGKQGPAKKSDQVSPMTMFRRVLVKDKNANPNASTPQNDQTKLNPNKAQEPCKSPPRLPRSSNGSLTSRHRRQRPRLRRSPMLRRTQVQVVVSPVRAAAPRTQQSFRFRRPYPVRWTWHWRTMNRVKTGPTSWNYVFGTYWA